MQLLSSDNGVLIYKCGRCPARLQRSRGRYEGRMVGEELYCSSCADDVEPIGVQQAKATEALRDFVRALARRRVRIDLETERKEAPMKKNDETQRAFEQGQEAWRDNKSQDANPHFPPNSAKYMAWNDGWESERKANQG